MRRVVLIVLFVALVSVPRAAWPQGNPLGPEFRVNTYTTSYQYGPSVAADSSGNFVVVWTSHTEDGGGDGVFGQRYAGSGTPVGPEFRVNTSTAADQSARGGTSVAADSSGNFVAVWESDTQDGSSFGVFGQRYASTGAPLGPEFRVNTYSTSGQYGPSVAADASGNLVVVWSSYGQDGWGGGIFGQRYASSGAPLGLEFRVNTYTTADQSARASVAADSSGNFVVVWESDTQDGDSIGIFGQRYSSAGAPVGPEFRVNTYTTGSQSAPSLAAGASGNFIVVWASDQDGSGDGVFGQRYASSGAPVGPEFRVNTYTTGSQSAPSVAADASGNFVVVWSSSREGGSFYGVFGQRYASSGTPLGPEFRVNTYTTNYQRRPSVAADSLGNFVVAWGGQAQDGSDYGVFGQRYGQIVPIELMNFRVE